MIKKIGYNRLKEILPTINAEEILFESYSSQSGYIDGFEIKGKDCYITYNIFCFDIDPRHRDDYILQTIKLLESCENARWINKKDSYYSYAKCDKNLLQLEIGE